MDSSPEYTSSLSTDVAPQFDKLSTRTIRVAPQGISVYHVSRLMAYQAVKAVVVADGLKPVGILTDRDIVVRVTARGLRTRSTSVESVMTSPVLTVENSDALSGAITLMERQQIKQVPVVDRAGQILTVLAVSDARRVKDLRSFLVQDVANLANTQIVPMVVRRRHGRRLIMNARAYYKAHSSWTLFLLLAATIGALGAIGISFYLQLLHKSLTTFPQIPTP